MNITEKISISFNKWGCPILDKSDDCYLSFKCNNPKSITIMGNEDGLRLLAKAIIGLIHVQSNEGFHIHLDEIYDINEENKNFIIDIVSKDKGIDNNKTF